MSILELYTRLVSNKLRCASFLEKVEATMTMIEVLFRYSIKHYRPIFIGFSGGRDSLTLILLTIELLKDKRELLKELSKEDLLHVFYIKVSGNTHRVNEEHVIEIMNEFLTRLNLSSKCFHIISRDKLINEKRTFIEALIAWGFPTPRYRWCMNEFKRRPLLYYIKNMLKLERFPIFMLGEKIGDGNKRRKILHRLLDNGLFTEFNRAWKQICVYPIIHWTSEDVREFLRYFENKNREFFRGMMFSKPWCILYNCLGTSGNCLYCMYMTDPAYYRTLASRSCTREFVEHLARAERLQKSKYVAILRGNNTKISIAEIVESTNVDSRHCRDCPMLYF